MDIVINEGKWKTGQQSGQGHSREPQSQKLSGPLIPDWSVCFHTGIGKGQRLQERSDHVCHLDASHNAAFWSQGGKTTVQLGDTEACIPAVCPPFSIGGIWAQWQDHHSTVKGNKWLWATLDLFGDCGGQGMGSNTCPYLQRVVFLALASKLTCVGSRFLKSSTNQVLKTSTYSVFVHSSCYNRTQPRWCLDLGFPAPRTRSHTFLLL